MLRLRMLIHWLGHAFGFDRGELERWVDPQGQRWVGRRCRICPWSEPKQPDYTNSKPTRKDAF